MLRLVKLASSRSLCRPARLPSAWTRCTRQFTAEASSAPLASASASDAAAGSEQVLRPRVRAPTKTVEDMMRILPIPPKVPPLDRRKAHILNPTISFEEEMEALIEYCDKAVDHPTLCSMSDFGKAYQCYLRVKAAGNLKRLSTLAWDRLLFVAARTYTVRNFNPIWLDMKNSLAPNHPGIHAYAIALHFWGVKRKQLDTMEATFAEMKAAGVAPNLHVYSTVIYAYAWAHEQQRMEKAFADLMADTSVKPDIAVFNTLLTLHPKQYQPGKPFFDTPTFGYWNKLVEAAENDETGALLPDERSFLLLSRHIHYHLRIMDTVVWAVEQLHRLSAASSKRFAVVRPAPEFYGALFHVIQIRHKATKNTQRFEQLRQDLRKYAELLLQDMVLRGVMYTTEVLKPLKALGVKTPLSGTFAPNPRRPSPNPNAKEELRAEFAPDDQPLARALKFSFPLHSETTKSLKEKEKAAKAAEASAKQAAAEATAKQAST